MAYPFRTYQTHERRPFIRLCRQKTYFKIKRYKTTAKLCLRSWSWSHSKQCCGRVASWSSLRPSHSWEWNPCVIWQREGEEKGAPARTSRIQTHVRARSDWTRVGFLQSCQQISSQKLLPLDISTQTGKRDPHAAHSPMPCLLRNPTHKRNHEHAQVHQG